MNGLKSETKLNIHHLLRESNTRINAEFGLVGIEVYKGAASPVKALYRTSGP